MSDPRARSRGVRGPRLSAKYLTILIAVVLTVPLILSGLALTLLPGFSREPLKVKVGIDNYIEPKQVQRILKGLKPGTKLEESGLPYPRLTIKNESDSPISTVMVFANNDYQLFLPKPLEPGAVAELPLHQFCARDGTLFPIELFHLESVRVKGRLEKTKEMGTYDVKWKELAGD